MTRDFAAVSDVLLLGPYPPPHGGVTSHLERLTYLLQEDGHSVRGMNYYGHANGPAVAGTLRRNPVRFWVAARSPRARIVHYHHSRFSCLLTVALARRRSPDTRFLLTLHGQELGPYLESPVFGRPARWAVRKFDDVIAVSPEVAAQVRPYVPNARLRTLPAFLPAPRGHREVTDEAGQRFRSDSQVVLAVSAYRIKRVPGGDLHGVATAVEAFTDFADELDDCRLAIFLARAPRGQDEQYLRSMLKGPASRGHGGRVQVFVGAPLWPVFSLPNVIYLRPTRTEGDAVSVREALAAGSPVIASDVVARPPEVICVPLDDRRGWLDAVHRTAETIASRPPERVAREPDDNAVSLHLALYRSHLDLPAREPAKV